MQNKPQRNYPTRFLSGVVMMCCSVAIQADELIFNFGGGPQVGSDVSGNSSRQTNYTVGVDYNFYHYERSERSSFVIGASYTYLGTNTDNNDQIHAVSIYPQLSLYPSVESWVNKLVPGNGAPFFYVRALGPSYISANQLGSRRQANHFAFQAQLGIGATYRLKSDQQASFAIAWKHFSNANLYDDNDGIDLPIVMTFGVRF
jgi:lipid A 3-O-deacylase